jgi:hypothetical protein
MVSRENTIIVGAIRTTPISSPIAFTPATVESTAKDKIEADLASTASKIGSTKKPQPRLSFSRPLEKDAGQVKFNKAQEGKQLPQKPASRQGNRQPRIDGQSSPKENLPATNLSKEKSQEPKQESKLTPAFNRQKVLASSDSQTNRISVCPLDAIPAEDISLKGKLVKDLSGMIKPPPKKVMTKNKSKAACTDRQVDYPSMMVQSPAKPIPKKKDMPAIPSVPPSSHMVQTASFQKAYLRKVKPIAGLTGSIKFEWAKKVSKARMNKIWLAFRSYAIASAYYGVLRKKLAIVIDKRYNLCQDYYRNDLDDTIRVIMG